MTGPAVNNNCKKKFARHHAPHGSFPPAPRSRRARRHRRPRISERDSSRAENQPRGSLSLAAHPAASRRCSISHIRRSSRAAAARSSGGFGATRRMLGLSLRIPLPPSANRLWRAGGGRVYRSPEYRSWLTETIWDMRAQAGAARIIGAYHLRLLVERPDWRRRDLDNFLKATSDALVHAGVIEADHLAESICIQWSGPGNLMHINLLPAEQKKSRAPQKKR